MYYGDKFMQLFNIYLCYLQKNHELLIEINLLTSRVVELDGGWREDGEQAGEYRGGAEGRVHQTGVVARPLHAYPAQGKHTRQH